jgi:hypothetical protein
VFNMWLRTCGLTDVLDLMSVPVRERRHTCYFRAAGALKAECGHTSKEPSVPTGLALSAGLQVIKVAGGRLNGRMELQGTRPEYWHLALDSIWLLHALTVFLLVKG